MRFWRTRQARDSSAMASDGIRITVGAGKGEATVTVAGRVTVDSSPHLRNRLLPLFRKSEISALVIDVSGVTYMDTSGIATLLESLKLAQESSVGLRLNGVHGQVRMLAEVAELPTIFRAAKAEVELS